MGRSAMVPGPGSTLANNDSCCQTLPISSRTTLHSCWPWTLAREGRSITTTNPCTVRK